MGVNMKRGDTVTKRWVVFGGGAWDQYIEYYDTEPEARAAAPYWLDRGFEVFIWDTVTDKQYQLGWKYDGLGCA